MTESFLTTLKELREKATAGPWSFEPAERDGDDFISPANLTGNDEPVWRVTLDDYSGLDDANAALIVHLVNHAELIEEMVEVARSVEQTLNTIMNECDVRHVPIDSEAASYCSHKADEAREQAAAAGSALAEVLAKLNGGAA